MFLKTVSAALAVGCLATGCASLPPTSAREVGELWPGYVNGYLPQSAWPDSLALLPPPPADGSAALAADVATFRALAAWRTTPRGALATSDAELHFPAAAGAFACALGVPVTESATPHLHMLLRRTLVDAAGPTYRAKTHYRRSRPFTVLAAPSCTPAEEAALEKDGSYPSGHSAIGWAWALVLTEIAPERTDAILQRGRSYAQSRAICGVHWESDVEAGRLVGAAAVARLHADPVFQAQRDLARKEVMAQRAAGAVPAGNCAAEAAAQQSSAGVGP